MLLAQDLFTELQGLFIQRLGLAVATLGRIQYRQVIHGIQGVRVLLAEVISGISVGFFRKLNSLPVSSFLIGLNDC